MARKNSNAGQPNRVAQKHRRIKHRASNGTKELRREYHQYQSRAVMGPLSEYLIPVTKPEGEVVSTLLVTVEDREMVAA